MEDPSQSLQISAGWDVDRKTLTVLINSAYKVGELGIMTDTQEAPFLRMTEYEVSSLVSSNKMLVASSGEHLVGCVKVDMLEGDVGEWGCLAVHESWQGKGLGSKLVDAAECHLRLKGCTVLQIELLTPSNWLHKHKERLRTWYLKLGYRLKALDDYRASTVTVSEGTLLLGRFLLATDADFTTYQKEVEAR